jgi:hypothetical protein
MFKLFVSELFLKNKFDRISSLHIAVEQSFSHRGRGQCFYFGRTDFFPSESMRHWFSKFTKRMCFKIAQSKKMFYWEFFFYSLINAKTEDCNMQAWNTVKFIFQKEFRYEQFKHGIHCDMQLFFHFELTYLNLLSTLLISGFIFFQNFNTNLIQLEKISSGVLPVV